MDKWGRGWFEGKGEFIHTHTYIHTYTHTHKDAHRNTHPHTRTHADAHSSLNRDACSPLMEISQYFVTSKRLSETQCCY